MLLLAMVTLASDEKVVNIMLLNFESSESKFP